MRIPRIYQDRPLAQGEEFPLDSQATVHVAKVLRLRAGDAVVVFNGLGGEYHGVLSRLDKRAAAIQLQSFVDTDVESPLNIILAQGLSRGERMDYTVQKAVELGVRRIVPVETGRTVVNLNQERKDKRRQHWQSVVHSACEQSGRNRVPEVAEVITLAQWLKDMPSQTQVSKFVLNHRVDRGVAALSIEPQHPVFVLIGPEGGLSEAEIEQAEQTGLVSVRLGPRVLRTETAALAFVSVLQGIYGDFK